MVVVHVLIVWGLVVVALGVAFLAERRKKKGGDKPEYAVALAFVDVDHLDSQSRRLAEHPPLDDPRAARGVVDILRTRALIAEITLSLVRLRDLVGATIGSPAEPELAVSVAPATT